MSRGRKTPSFFVYLPLLLLLLGACTQAPLSKQREPARDPAECGAIFSAKPKGIDWTAFLAKLPPLPGHFFLEHSASRSSQLFELVSDRWTQQILDNRKFRKTVKDPSKDDIDVLKAARKHFTVLRSAYVLFSADHKPPERLDEVTRAFGKLNDAFTLNGKKKAIREAAQEFQRSLKDLETVGRKFDEFKPSTRHSLQKLLAERHGEIEALVSQKKLSAETFHEIRKYLKDELVLMQIYAEVEPTPDVIAARDYFFQLNEILGSIHDEMVEAELSGKKSYDKIRIEIPGELRGSILALLERFDGLASRNEAKSYESIPPQVASNRIQLDEESGTYLVLRSDSDGVLTVKRAGNAAEASARALEAESQGATVNLQARVAEGRAAHPRLRARLERVAAAIDDSEDGPRVASRVKSFESLKAKVFDKAATDKKAFRLDFVPDIVGMRLIIANPAEFDVALAAVRSEFGDELLKVRERDYDDGYHAFHAVGALASGMRFEIQIVTELMSKWMRWEHDRLYKAGSDESKDLYFKRLQRYSLAVVEALKDLETGNLNARLPSASKFGIKPEDEFVLDLDGELLEFDAS